MARKWSNANLPGALHFVTGNFFNRLVRKEYRWSVFSQKGTDWFEADH